MEFFQARFPTKKLQRLELRLGQIAHSELEWWRENPGFSAQSLSRVCQFTSTFHQAYDQWLGEALKQHQNPIQCKANCGNCCHHYPQSVEGFEALALYVQIRKDPSLLQGMAECWDRLKNYQEVFKKIEPESEEQCDQVLQSYFALKRPCPFLNSQGSCSVYAWRPITCRMYFSETDPQFCTAEHLLSPQNRSFHVCLPDALEEDLAELTEILNLNLSESLYESLLELNAREGEGLFDSAGTL